MKNKRNVIEDESASRKKLKDIGTPGDDNKVDTPGDENKVEKGDDDVVPTNGEEVESPEPLEPPANTPLPLKKTR